MRNSSFKAEEEKAWSKGVTGGQRERSGKRREIKRGGEGGGEEGVEDV